MNSRIRILFRPEFTDNGSVADVAAQIVGRQDADGFSLPAITLRASELPSDARLAFASLQASIAAEANAGGWRLTQGEIAQTGSTSDFEDVPNPKAGEEGEPATLRQPVPGTERPVLTMWMTQQKDGSQRNTSQTSEQWPQPVRDAVLALWQWAEARA